MATSGKSTSIRKAQVPVSCYFCKGQELKWKCEDCNVRMCNSCKGTVHQGLQCSQDHDVVSIQDIGQSPGSQEVTTEVISSFFNSYTTTLPAVQILLCLDDDLVYFSYNTITSDQHQFVKGKLLKSSIKILQTFKRKISDFAINREGEVLLIEFRDHKIQMLSPAGEVKTVLDTSPMTLLAIHVNKRNEVIVGLREPGPPFPVRDFSIRQIIIFGNDFQRKNTLEFDKKGDKLFSYTLCIRTDSRNGVYVIDRVNDEGYGKVVAVNRNGRLKFIYDGQMNFRTFKPHAITITPNDNIVVTDSDNEALHIISSKGDLLGLQLVFKDLGIEYPYSVCIDNEGYLLIGCGFGENAAYGKIYVVRLKDSLM